MSSLDWLKVAMALVAWTYVLVVWRDDSQSCVEARSPGRRVERGQRPSCGGLTTSEILLLHELFTPREAARFLMARRHGFMIRAPEERRCIIYASNCAVRNARRRSSRLKRP